MFILLTPEQADHVKGPDLQPRMTLAGNYALNTLVLSDPAHEAHWEYLSALPQTPAVEWPAEVP